MPEQQQPIQVSVIIPVYNAGRTVAKTLDSLIDQSYPHWDAIIVDDGSSDSTISIVTDYIRRDARFRLVQGGHAGVSAARNTGIDQAGFDWLLFLDADDWVTSDFLEKMTNVLLANPKLDAVHCGWGRVSEQGLLFDQHAGAGEGDLSGYFQAACYFAIHACVVRRPVVAAAGNFNPQLKTCEDWDLWERITVAGTRFGVVPDIMALYLTHADSASFDAHQLVGDCFHVLERSHLPGRVASMRQALDGSTEHETLAELLAARKYLFVCWCAGLMIGKRLDPLPMLDMFPVEQAVDLAPGEVANHLFTSILLPECRLPNTEAGFWAQVGGQIGAFLDGLESHLRAEGLASQVIYSLWRSILDHTETLDAAAIGAAQAVNLDICQPLPDLQFPAGAERLFCRVLAGDEKLGVMELPIFDGFVPAWLLADVIAAEFAWKLVEKFFKRSVFPHLKVEKQAGSLSVWRGDVLLARDLPDEQNAVENHLHQRAGWTIFLQEFFGYAEKGLDWFYNPDVRDDKADVLNVQDGWVRVDLTRPLTGVSAPGELLQAVVAVGDAVVGVLALPVVDGKVTDAALRSAIIKGCGFELCRVAVREGLLGRSLDESLSLRQRLLAVSSQDVVHLERKGSAGLVDGWQGMFSRYRNILETAWLLPRRSALDIDSSASRRVVFSVDNGREWQEGIRLPGEEVLNFTETGDGQPVGLIYNPDQVLRTPVPVPLAPSRAAGQRGQPAEYGRDVFESLFASQADPWLYTSPYEQIKYEQTLELLPDQPIHSALELACAEGHFTVQLASHVERLVASDISHVALQRAAQRCAQHQNIDYLPLDFARNPIPGKYELLVCSEVLYYVGDHSDLVRVAKKMADALLPGGYLLMAHAHLVVDEPTKPGFNWDHPFGAATISQVFCDVPSLRLVRELRTPLYRIQLFQRVGGLLGRLWKPRPAINILASQPVTPPPGADVQVLWHGGSPQIDEGVRKVETDRLPVLMYHRVAPEGSQKLARYRVTPGQFEEQLRYLRDTGYYSITIEEWHAAMREHQSLPGRAVLLTFDDGYKDFYRFAWPLLQKYGFSALVFLVAEAVGGSNHWDHQYEQLPLMDWGDIRVLQGEGVQFGSHTANHRALTAIPPAAAAREMMLGRAILENRLEQQVSAIAYPFGAQDAVVQHLAGGAGYIYGFTCQPGRCSLWERLLGMPRIEVSGLDSFSGFVKNLA